MQGYTNPSNSDIEISMEICIGGPLKSRGYTICVHIITWILRSTGVNISLAGCDHTLLLYTCQCNNYPVKVMEILGEKITTLHTAVWRPGGEGQGKEWNC